MKDKKKRVWLSLGGNIVNPKKQINIAINMIAMIPNTKFISNSSYYISRPFGFKNQPDFLNVTVVLDTTLSPEMLLDSIQNIEIYCGRKRNNYRFGPRTLDIDILLFDNEIINTSRLIVPHYDIYNREFFLYPLLELNPDLLFPNGKSLESFVKKISKNGIRLYK